MDKNDDVLLYSVSDIARVLNIGINKAYQLCNSGLLPVLKIGGYKVRKSALEQFVIDYEGYDLTDCNNIHKVDKVNNTDDKKSANCLH